jgi:hypothetical protein
MAQQSGFIERRDPKQNGRRSTDAIGAALGGTVGAVAKTAARAVGGVIGAAAAFVPRSAKVDAAAEEAFWREHYASEPYYNPGYNFADYLPAYRAGWEALRKSSGSRFEDLERELEAEFHWNRGQSRLLWEDARHAARAAFERSR